MLRLATWLRESDEPHFGRFFEKRGDLAVFNARRDSAVDGKDADGLLLSGGPDISASFLRQEVPDPSVIEDPEPSRDAWEFQALEAALAARKPVFAICKGHQVLNVALGGTLLLDISGHDQPEMKMENTQPMRYAAGAQHQFPFVNSSHHQAIDRLADGLEIEAWCATDGIIEQVRLRDYPFCLGVQYHPERDSIYAPLFEDFFERLGS
ncbi:MAG: putative glutamine amidotransferase [Chthoniobacter sp.]|jgi:putative glutamine amidotransferase|nr:putative glutamine amidotransferase [Chthoniobacter sp.]